MSFVCSACVVVALSLEAVYVSIPLPHCLRQRPTRGAVPDTDPAQRSPEEPLLSGSPNLGCTEWARLFLLYLREFNEVRRRHTVTMMKGVHHCDGPSIRETLRRAWLKGPRGPLQPGLAQRSLACRCGALQFRTRRKRASLVYALAAQRVGLVPSEVRCELSDSRWL